MTVFIKKHPALSLTFLAMVLATLPMLSVAVGWLPAGFSQLGALSASAAAFILTAIESRKHGVKELFRRAFIWKVGIGWWIFAIASTAIVSLGALVIFSLVYGKEVNLSGAVPWYEIFPMMVFLTLFAGFGEEFGWRGYLIPKLQVRHSALVASLIIGALHSLWHTPMFFMEGQSQYEWVQEIGFLPAWLGYAACVTAWAVQFTWVFNNTRGSVLLAAVVHGVGNTWMGGYFAISEQTGITGNLIMTGLMIVVSIIIVIYAGPERLSRKPVSEGLIRDTESPVRAS